MGFRPSFSRPGVKNTLKHSTSTRTHTTRNNRVAGQGGGGGGGGSAVTECVATSRVYVRVGKVLTDRCKVFKTAKPGQTLIQVQYSY